ncbi:amidase family protein [candidate division KSB1 bacterium]
MTGKKVSSAAVLLTIAAVVFVLGCNNTSSDFTIAEATISQIHKAMKSGDITSRQLVEYYLERIEAYDKSSGLNAIVVVNPNALQRADELDEEFRRTGEMRPLHGIPVIVKDNYDTHDLQTAAGCLALKGSLPPDDAFMVQKIREAGAIVLVKSNMDEFAFSPLKTESSILGTTANPYALDRVPAGSSGGSGAAVAANFGAVGLGTDTGNSIRGPSSHTCLVGIRPTIGLTSRDGIVPLYLTSDVGGPMARTVEDAARVLNVVAGFDPADPVTEACLEKIPDDYTVFLDKDGLKGARIGVVRSFTERESADTEIKALFDKAIGDFRLLGAEIVDPFEIPRRDRRRRSGAQISRFRYYLNNYLATLGEDAPVRNLQDIVDSGKYGSSIDNRLKRELRGKLPESEEEIPPLVVENDSSRLAFREAILQAMEEYNIDAFIFPTWSNPPRKLDDQESPAGDNSQSIAPATGQPALTVPMGFSYGEYPAGLQIVGKPFDEQTLIKFAYAYEQGTKHRLPPETFPEIK